MIRLLIRSVIKNLVNELFIRGRKLHGPFLFITQSYFTVRNDVRLNATLFFVIKIQNRRQLHEIAITHTSDIDFAEFKRLYRRYMAKPYSFLLLDTTLPSDNQFHFRKYPLEEV